jgi:hypothetical protein
MKHPIRSILVVRSGYSESISSALDHVYLIRQALARTITNAANRTILRQQKAKLLESRCAMNGVFVQADEESKWVSVRIDELLHHRVHVHLVLFGDLFVELMDDHQSEQESRS